MESQRSSTTQAAVAVTQALEKIHRPSTRRSTGIFPSATERTQQSRPIAKNHLFHPASFFFPIVLGSQGQTTHKNHIHVRKENLQHNHTPSNVALANHTEPAWSPLRQSSMLQSPQTALVCTMSTNGDRQQPKLPLACQPDGQDPACDHDVALYPVDPVPQRDDTTHALHHSIALAPHQEQHSRLSHSVAPPRPLVCQHYQGLRSFSWTLAPSSTIVHPPADGIHHAKDDWNDKVVSVAPVAEQKHARSSSVTPRLPPKNARKSLPRPCNENSTRSIPVGPDPDDWQRGDEFDFAVLLKPSKSPERVAPLPLSGRVSYPLTPDKGNARALLIRRIRRTGLQVQRLVSLDGKQSLLKVRAPAQVLERGAERLRLRKKRQFDHVWMGFTCILRATFADFDPDRTCVRFLDSEKQRIVHALLSAPASEGGAGLNDSCALAARYVMQMYPLHKHDLASLQTRWVTFWRTSFGASPSLHGHEAPWAMVRHIVHQPLDDVAQYFGERVAFYFAWMEMYTRWLVVPSGAGVVLFALQVSSHQIDHPAAPVYALFMTLWTAYFIIAWRRRAARLAYHWGTWGYEDEEVTRPEFYGHVSDTLDGKVGNEHNVGRRRYSLWKRGAKYSVTFPCVAGSIAAVVTMAYVAFSTRDRLEADSLKTKHEAAVIADQIKESGTITVAQLQALAQLGVRWDFWVYLLLTPLLYGLLIPVLDAAFTRAAQLLTQWENHRTESRYQTHLILKVFSFRFVHVFASLYYYAFAPRASSLLSQGKTQATRSDGMVHVAIQLASFMVTGQVWKNVMETLLPFVRRQMEVRAKRRASNDTFKQATIFNGRITGPVCPRSTATNRVTEATMSSNAVIHEQCVRLEQASDRAWEEAGLKHYDTFEDYTEMLVQFGYVSLFSLAFPLAPLLALLNNLVELRTDAFKLCHTRQRPLAHKASGIGVWLHVLQSMSVLAVLTNCFHVAYSTLLLERAFPLVTATEKVWIVFGIEHLLLLLQLWLACAVPSVPRDVLENLSRERELAKHDSARAMAARLQVRDDPVT